MYKLLDFLYLQAVLSFDLRILSIFGGLKAIPGLVGSNSGVYTVTLLTFCMFNKFKLFLAA